MVEIFKHYGVQKNLFELIGGRGKKEFRHEHLCNYSHLSHVVEFPPIIHPNCSFVYFLCISMVEEC